MTAVGGRASEIDFDRLVDDLQTLVRTESITGSEEIVADWAAGALQEVGLTVEMVRPDLPTLRADPDWPGHEMPRTSLPIVVGRAGRAGGRRLILSGHLDVVPPGDPATWSMDPWSGELVDGRLYGRGACDMKGGVAAILAAVRMLAVGGGLDTLDGELQVVLVPSEEDGGQGTLGAIRAGATGDMAIITEPSRLDVIVAHGGAITFRLTVPGRAAHASRRREGISALDKLLVLTQALAVDEKRRNEAETDPLMTALGLPYPTIIGIVEGGEWASTVLDRVVAYGRYGVRLGQTPADAEAELQTVVAEACAADEFLREHPATIEITGGRFGSALMSQDHPLPAGLVEVAAEVMGRRPAMRAEPYGADMQMFVNHGGTPCVIFGPGDIKYGHSADEFVPIAEVETCARVLAAWVLREIGGG